MTDIKITSKKNTQIQDASVHPTTQTSTHHSRILCEGHKCAHNLNPQDLPNALYSNITISPSVHLRRIFLFRQKEKMLFFADYDYDYFVVCGYFIKKAIK